MIIRSNRALARWLHREIYGRELPRARRARHTYRGPARNARYRAWIRSLPSVVSGLTGCEAAHTGRDGGMRQKSSDYSCIPLTPAEHREYHQIGKKDFARKHRLNIPAVVRRLNDCWIRGLLS